jgi:hypothetical protein
MNQVGHIFTKDVRRHWPEIAATLGLTGLFGWTMSHQTASSLNAGGPEYLGGVLALAMLLALLLPVSWWVTITRLVQGESLVGDTQWWITKPYEWGRLLAAKILFLATFVLAPLFLAQLWLLWAAGFNPLGHWGGLTLDVALTAAVIVVPLMALSTVTKSLSRVTVTILGVLLAMIAGAALIGWLHIGRMTTSAADEVVYPAMLLLALAAIVLQYARRQVWASRGMLAAAVVLMGVGAACSTNAGLIAMTYPQNGATAAAAVAYDAQLPAWTNPTAMHEVRLMLPLHAAGLTAGSGVILDGVRATVTTADGRRWESAWQPANGTRIVGAEGRGYVPVQMKAGFYEAARQGPVTIRLRLAAVDIRAGNTKRLTMGAGDFVVPGVGICTPQNDNGGRGYSTMRCWSAVRPPQLTQVTGQWSQMPCGQNVAGAPEQTAVGDAWFGQLHPAVTSGLNPVVKMPVNLSNPLNPPLLAVGNVGAAANASARRYLCPGAPLSFTPYREVAKTQYETTIADFQLPEVKQEKVQPFNSPGLHVETRTE